MSKNKKSTKQQPIIEKDTSESVPTSSSEDNSAD